MHGRYCGRIIRHYRSCGRMTKAWQILWQSSLSQPSNSDFTIFLYHRTSTKMNEAITPKIHHDINQYNQPLQQSGHLLKYMTLIVYLFRRLYYILYVFLCNLSLVFTWLDTANEMLHFFPWRECWIDLDSKKLISAYCVMGIYQVCQRPYQLSSKHS